ncbi:MAG: transposase family protein [Burkholderiales bacterium]|nr:transposase family protein [Burkholderiales bacterium]
MSLEAGRSGHPARMIVTLHTDRLTRLEQIERFLDGTAEVAFQAPRPAERRDWIAQMLGDFHYARRPRQERGLLLRYLVKVTGYSPAQTKRLVRQFAVLHHLRDRRGPPARPFARRYTLADQQALAELDALHGNLSGPATRLLAERAFRLFGEARYQRLATISVAHLYNLRRATGYRRARGAIPTKTASTVNTIGQRRRPDPDGQPGYVRIDSVHQGDLDDVKGVYLINAVDSVTQFQFVAAVERISENYLLPVLHALLARFPFVLRGFHADNGSEYINHRVAELLAKLNIELTKSRPRHSNDNALAETKNGAIVRKHLGYAHIPGHFAASVNAFTLDVLSPYLNFHRPCFFPLTITDHRGRQRKVYRAQDMMTPFDKLVSLPDASSCLKPGLTLDALHTAARALSDSHAARALNLARATLFAQIAKPQKTA